PDRDLAKFADDRPVPLVARMDCDRAVAKHRLRSGRGYRDVVALLGKEDLPVGVALDVIVRLTASEGIFEVPHVATNFAVLDLEITDRGLEPGVPIDEPLVAINEPALVQLNERVRDRSLV